MAEKLITNYADFDTDSIKFAAPRVNAKGGTCIKITDKNNKPINLQTPLILTWGVNEMKDEKDPTRVGYSMALQMPDEKYATATTSAFHDKLKALEDKIIDMACDHSEEWLGEKKSRDVMMEKISPMLKHPKVKESKRLDKSRPPTLKLKIPFWENKFGVELYDTNQKPVFQPSMDITTEEFVKLIPKGSHVAAIMYCSGLWIVAGNIYITWQLTQAVVRKPVRIQHKCFISIDDADKDEMEKLEEAEKKGDVQTLDDGPDDVDVDDTAVNDTDDESDKAKSEDDEPAPVKPKARVVRRKAAKKD